MIWLTKSELNSLKKNKSLLHFPRLLLFLLEKKFSLANFKKDIAYNCLCKQLMFVYTGIVMLLMFDMISMVDKSLHLYPFPLLLKGRCILHQTPGMSLTVP